ncbi:hypothetical protein [Streptosporangium sp. NPDC051022]|uniref:hypothetical protein n=1 Tax=Streptosporangium sp. NPDC051022 TaxID=3155752 RepID=UPI003444ECDC
MRGTRARMTAEWAVWGKKPEDRDYTVQSCSGGVLTPETVTAIMDRFSAGTPNTLPEVTISWFGRDDLAHVGLAVQEWSDRQDRVGRRIAVTRYFCVPYARLAEHPVSYEALFHAFEGLTPPADGPLVVDLPIIDPEELAARVTYEAMGTAALLFTRRPVCVEGAENLPLLERLRFLDTVAALLPYGLRGSLSAATWASSTAAHRIRLSFSKYAPSGANLVVWGRAPLVSDAGEHDADTYARLLAEHGHGHGYGGHLVAHLAGATGRLTFRPSDFPETAGVFDRFGTDLRPPDTSAPDLLVACADAMDRGDAADLERNLAALAFVTTARERSGEERAALLAVIKERRMLAEEQPVPGLGEEVFRVLLTVSCGRTLGPEHLEVIEDAAGGLHDSLIEAMLGRPAAEAAVTLTLAHRLGDGRLAEEVRRMTTADLVEAAAEPPARLWLVEAVCAELETRSQDRDLAQMLHRHGYLAGPLATVYAGRGDMQMRRLSSLLRAAHGPVLDDAGFDRILGEWPVLPPAALFGAVMRMYGTGSRERLIDVTLTDFLKLAGFDEPTLAELLALLRDAKPAGRIRRRAVFRQDG